MSKYRIRLTEIEGAEKSGGRGGKAEVVRATFRRNKGARGEAVAVKKLLCGNITDKETVSKVRSQTAETSRAVLMDRSLGVRS